MSALATTINPQDLIDNRLKFVLSKYIEFNQEEDQLVLKARREIAISRNALEEANTTYINLIDTLKSQISTLSITKGDISQLMQSIGAIQSQSLSIITCAEKVTRILHTATQIEAILSSRMDGMQVYAVAAQLPSMIKTVILNATKDEALANQCANDLELRIKEELLVIEGTVENTLQPVIDEQIKAMLESVPSK